MFLQKHAKVVMFLKIALSPRCYYIQMENVDVNKEELKGG
jgi:hypothetical protein